MTSGSSLGETSAVASTRMSPIHSSSSLHTDPAAISGDNNRVNTFVNNVSTVGRTVGSRSSSLKSCRNQLMSQGATHQPPSSSSLSRSSSANMPLKSSSNPSSSPPTLPLKSSSSSSPASPVNKCSSPNQPVVIVGISQNGPTSSTNSCSSSNSRKSHPSHGSTCIVAKVKAQVMTRDDTTCGWLPISGGGLSQVMLIRRYTCSSSESKSSTPVRHHHKSRSCPDEGTKSASPLPSPSRQSACGSPITKSTTSSSPASSSASPASGTNNRLPDMDKTHAKDEYIIVGTRNSDLNVSNLSDEDLSLLFLLFVSGAEAHDKRTNCGCGSSFGSCFVSCFLQFHCLLISSLW